MSGFTPPPLLERKLLLPHLADLHDMSKALVDLEGFDTDGLQQVHRCEHQYRRITYKDGGVRDFAAHEHP